MALRRKRRQPNTIPNISITERDFELAARGKIMEEKLTLESRLASIFHGFTSQKKVEVEGPREPGYTKIKIQQEECDLPLYFSPPIPKIKKKRPEPKIYKNIFMDKFENWGGSIYYRTVANQLRYVTLLRQVTYWMAKQWICVVKQVK